MLKNRFFKISIGIILILLILYLFNQVEYIFGPLKELFSFLIIPILVSIFLYYLLRPIVSFLTKKIKFKSISIILTFFLLIVIILTVIYFGGSIIQTQIISLSKEFSSYFDSIMKNINNAIAGNDKILNYIKNYQLEEKITAFAENLINGIRNNLLDFFSAVTNIGTILILIPFILFYFLRDDKKIYHVFLNLLPGDRREKINSIFLRIDDTLSKYIGGQLIIALIIGFLTYLGFLLIRLPNGLILSLIILFTSFVPFIGAIIGSIPAVLIALSTNFFMVIKVLIVIIIAQQIEGNLIQPKIQGNRLSIHPLMVIIVVLSFVTLFGILGALFAVPLYVVLRIIVGDIYYNRYFKK